MTILTHTLGFPRVGLRRELKKAQESYWAGNSTREALLAVGRELRARHWEQQKQAGIDLLPVGDFAWYDHVLTTSLLLGNVPARHQNNDGSVDIDTLFRIGRGRAPTGEPAAAAEMTKWFNTNYHYIVPESAKASSSDSPGHSCWRKWTKRWRWGIRSNPYCWGLSRICGWVK